MNQRALQTINVREEQERFNVWMAYLNLENLYGNVDKVISQKVIHDCDISDYSI